MLSAGGIRRLDISRGLPNVRAVCIGHDCPYPELSLYVADARNACTTTSMYYRVFASYHVTGTVTLPEYPQIVGECV